MKVRTKICGITRLQDAVFAAQAGVDAIGLVFFPPSSRDISHDLKTARTIALSVGPFVSVVGLFVNSTAEEVNTVLSKVPLHLLQFHGEETEDFCVQFDRPYLKALRMKDGINVSERIRAYPSAAGILVDSYKKGLPGGTGETFDWDRVPKKPEKPIVLAGGLSPSLVGKAVNIVKPYGVDVSGGVELKPGIKCSEKMKAFIENAVAE